MMYSDKHDNATYYRSSWRDDARLAPRTKQTTPRGKLCPKCGTYAHVRRGDPCPFCNYLDSNDQRQYYAYKQWRRDKAQEQRDDAELDRILGN